VTRDDAAAPALPPLEQPSDTPIAARIVTCLLDSAREVRVADVRIGLGYTAVRLAHGRTGVAFTFRDQAQGCCSVWNGPRPLCARGAADLLPLLDSEDAIEAGVGLASANALANQDPRDSLDGEVLAHLDLTPDDQVAMVGHFGPLVGPKSRAPLTGDAKRIHGGVDMRKLSQSAPVARQEGDVGRCGRRALRIRGLLAAALVTASPLTAQEPRALPLDSTLISVPAASDVTRANRLLATIMSPFCPGLTLADCPSSSAESLRVAIRSRLGAGELPDSIVESLVAAFGEGVRGAPRARGLGLALWALPLLALGVGGIGLLRWLRHGGVSASPAPADEGSNVAPPAATPAERAALEAALRRYD
jgi:cytochrome c-type biogenesis protein CcmH/NrfF